MRGYVILYNGKKYEDWTDDIMVGQYEIKRRFCEKHKIRPSQQWKVSVHLAEKNGEVVTHSTAGL